jgi:hypothetical protein
MIALVKSKGKTVMTDAINAKDEVLDCELDAVSGGCCVRCPSGPPRRGQNDAAAMFEQILRQLTGG